jgi:enediyne biosynthesis protein E5
VFKWIFIDRQGKRDARDLQILALLILYMVSRATFDFVLPVISVIVILASGWFWQLFWCRIFALNFQFKSTLISCLSLAILIRTDHWLWILLATTLTISSKFLLRVRGKHVFNPSNFGIAATLVLSGGHVWVQHGLWPESVFLGLFILLFGLMVITRAKSLDITIAFIVFYGLLQFGYGVLHHDPTTITFHSLKKASLMIFAFFMISDPISTPNHPLARLLFVLLVIVFSGVFQYLLYSRDSLFYALLLASTLTPLWDALFRKERFRWRALGTPP